MRYYDLMGMVFLTSTSEGIIVPLLPFLVQLFDISSLTYGLIVPLNNIVRIFGYNLLMKLNVCGFSHFVLLVFVTFLLCIGYSLLSFEHRLTYLVISRVICGFLEAQRLLIRVFVYSSV